jgi:serine/threonine protein phosphatase PrpC
MCRPGDLYLLCSDGLSDMLDDASIGQVLLAHDSLTPAQALIDAANDAGGKDNISVILARASGGATAPARRPGGRSGADGGCRASGTALKSAVVQPCGNEQRGQAWASWWFRSTVW